MAGILDLSPELIDLGLALGVLTGTPQSPQPDNEFFSDPSAKLGGVLAEPDQRAAALRLLSRVLDGSATPSSVDGEEWVALVTQEQNAQDQTARAGEPEPRLGLWGVVTERAGGAVDLAIAVLVRHDGDIGLSLTARVPLLRLASNGTASFLAGGPNGAITIDAGIELGDAVALGDLSIEGLSIALVIPTNGSDPTVEVRAAVPPTGEAGDLVLDSSTDLGGQLVELLLRFGAAAAGDAADELAHLLDLLGLGTDPGIPALPVDQVVTGAQDALWGWVRSLASPSTIETWLGHLGELIGADPVAGAATPADPARLCVTPGQTELCLTVAVDSSGPAPVLVLGAALRADAPASFTAGGTAELTATLARITLGPSPVADLAPGLEASVTIGERGGTAFVVDTDVPGIGPTRVDAVRAGLVLGADGVAPVIEALGVDLGSAGTFPVLDLTDTEALLDVAGSALDAVIADVLATLGADDTAAALLVLAGVRRPSGQTEATWPHDVALPALFSDPVGAVSAYHRTVLAAGQWPVLATHVAQLLGVVGTATVAGNGADVDPWRIELADTAVGRAELLAWTSTTADGIRLHLGVDLVPPALALTGETEGPTVSLHVRAELVSLRLATAGGGAAPVDPVALGSLGATLELGDGLRLDAGFMAIDADRIVGGVVWDRQRGLQPALRVDGAALVALPAPIPVPLPRLDPDTGRWVWDGEIPYELLERLLAAAIDAASSALARDASRVLGWRDAGPTGIAVPPMPGVPATAVGDGRLRLEDLVDDPLAAAGSWAVDLLTGPQGQEWAEAVLGWLARAAAGSTAGITGTGAAADPWGAALGASGRARFALTRGQAPAPLGRSAPAVPLAVADVSDGIPAVGAPPSVLVATLQRAAVALPAIRDLLDRPGDPIAAFTALAGSVTGTDGLTPATSQLALPGATQIRVESTGLAHAALTFRAERDMPGGPPPAGRIHVRLGVAGLLDWADAQPDRTIDLTTPGLTAAAFDLTTVTGDGPWFVVLPPRAAAGAGTASAQHAELVARLRRVVDTARANRPGQPLALIAHGPAGHVARTVAADASSGVTHLTTIATAHGGGSLDLSAGLVAEGFRLVQSLRGLVPDPRGELPYADELLATLEATLDPPTPGAEGGPAPIAYPRTDTDPAVAGGVLPGSVSAVAVAATLTAGDVERALAEVVRYAVRAGVLAALEQTENDPSGGTALGWRADAVRPQATPGVRVGVTFGPDLLTVTAPDRGDGIGPLPLAGPRLVVTVRLDRAGSWLLGNATAPLRARAVEVTATAGLGTGSTAGVVITVHDASVLGVTRTRWVVDLADPARATHLTPEERVLLGAAIEALGPVPGAGPARAAADLLAALGIVSVAFDGAITVDLTTVETALTHAASVVGAASDAARTQAIAAVTALLGGSTIDLGDDLEVVVELAPRSPAAITLRTRGDGAALPVGLTLAGSLRVDLTGRVNGSIAVSSATTGPNRRVALQVTIDTSSATPVAGDLRLLAAGGAAVRTVPLLPVPDPAGILDLVTEVAPAALLRLAIEALRNQVPVSGALLQALGFGAVDAPVRLPATFLADPVAWLLDTSSLGLAGGRPDPAQLVALVDAVRTFTGTGGPSGTVELPWDLRLRVAPDGSGGVSAQLAWPAPVVAGPVRLGGSAGLTLTASGQLQPVLASDIDLLDGATVLGGVSISVAPAAVTASGRVGSTTVALLPSGPGLGSLAAAATKALPIVLDAVAGSPAPVGPAITALGDALGLRDGTGFLEAELVELAGDPTGQLVARLRTNVPGALAALRTLAQPVLPGAGVVQVTGTVITVRPVPELSISVDLGPVTIPTPAPPELCVTVTGVEPVDGLSLSVSACVTDGLEELTLALAVVDADLLLGLLPELTFRIGRATPTPAGQVDLALWSAAPTVTDRQALVAIAQLGTGTVVVRCRHADGTDHVDLTGCTIALVTEVVVPQLLDLVLDVPDVRTALETRVADRAKIGELLVPELLTRTGSGASLRYRVTGGALALDGLPGRSLRTLVHGLDLLAGDLALPGLEPLTLGIAIDDTDTPERIGVHLGIEGTGDFELVNVEGLRLAIEADARWIARAEDEDPDGAVGGVDLFLLTMPAGAAAVPRLEPRIAVRGVGVRAEHPEGGKLIDLGVSVRSVGVHAWYERSFSGPADQRGGGHVELDAFALPLGSAGGNPVASSFLTGDGSGDPASASPAFSPALAVWSTGGPVEVDVRAGEGDGPWWLPVQQAFGPLYIDQLGFGVGRRNGDVDSVSLLIDGGTSVAGLTIAVDDLAIIVPWATPLELSTWRLDLAGFAVGYSGSGLSVAGGMKKFDRNGTPDYVGMVQIQFPPYGATGVGAYGVFPDGAGGEYTSFFVFAAVTAPIGGPPAFFVTGLGGGFGLNRQLIAPDDVADVPDFPLVAAFTGSMADDPMGALETLGDTFPPQRGAIWFAAGLSFTSFALVYSTAVITVAIDGGLELNLFGLSKLALPPAPAPPMAQIELALHARFSSEEAVLSVLAQLTDNSWIVNESVRLTGGFAFVIWFKTGQFVFTIGGYGPAFDKPSYYPDVPRVGFAWTPSSSVVVKGGGYFALTSSCVMAGGELEVSYNSGSVWAKLEVGVHVLVSWDPFFYDFRVYVEISAGVRWKTWLGTIKLSFSFGVRVHVLGPKLRGTATLDLDVITVTVRFGPTSAANSDARIGWDTFLSDYVLEPPSDSPSRHALVASIMTGQLLPGVAANGEGQADPETADDGTSARPFRVVPEFELIVQTRRATNAVTQLGTALESGVRTRQLDLGPTGYTNVTSTLSVQVMRFDNITGGLFDHTSGFARQAEYGNVPEAVWKVLPLQPDVAEEKVIRTCTGVRYQAVPTIVPGAVVIDVAGVEVGTKVHPLPFAVEVTASHNLYPELRDLAGTFDEHFVGASTTDVIDHVRVLVTAGSLGDTRLTDDRLDATRAAAPRLVSLAHGIAELERPVVGRIDRPVPDIVIVQPEVAPVPRLEAVLRASAPAAGPGGGWLVAGSTPSTSVKSTVVPRTAPPTLAAVRTGLALRIGSRPRGRCRSGAAAAGHDAAAGHPAGHARRGDRPPARVLRAPSSPAGRKLAAATTKKLTQQGATVRAGDTQVWVRDGSEFDHDEARPSVHVAGSTARVVVLDRGGAVMAEAVATDAAVEVPSARPASRSWAGTRAPDRPAGPAPTR